jgi:hypothetical protein
LFNIDPEENVITGGDGPEATCNLKVRLGLHDHPA